MPDIRSIRAPTVSYKILNECAAESVIAEVDMMLSDKPMVGIVLSLVAGILMLIILVGSIGRPIRSIEFLELGDLSWAPSVVMRLCFAIGWAVLILI